MEEEIGRERKVGLECRERERGRETERLMA